MLKDNIKAILKKNDFLSLSDMRNKLNVDKSKLSGYLEAMVDYGDISVKAIGNSKAYYLGGKDK